MDTENDPNTAVEVLNSSMTYGIAGENMADAIGLNQSCTVLKYVRKHREAIIAIKPTFLLVL